MLLFIVLTVVNDGDPNGEPLSTREYLWGSLRGLLPELGYLSISVGVLSCVALTISGLTQHESMKLLGCISGLDVN